MNKTYLERETNELPICSCCDRPILQDMAVCIKGEWFCDWCLKYIFRKVID